MPRERIPPSKVERGPSNEIVCSIADHITTNIPFTCYHLYGRNLQTKRHEHDNKYSKDDERREYHGMKALAK